MKAASNANGIKVAFYRRLSNSYGHDFDVVLSEIMVDDSCPNRAVAEAIHMFEKERGLYNWTVLADGYQVVEHR